MPGNRPGMLTAFRVQRVHDDDREGGGREFYFDEDGVVFGGKAWIKGGEPWFDVKAFGAYGDGVHDDDKAVQDAVSAVTAAGGGVLYFPKGRYLLAVQHMDAANGYCIFVPDNCIVLGAGRNATELLCGVADSDVLYNRAGSNITVQGMKLNGNALANNADCIKFLSTSGVNIFDVDTTAARMGVQLLGCTDVSIVSCHARNQVRDAALDDARGFSIGDLAPYTGTARVQLTNCKAFTSADHGFSIFTNASDVQLVNCHALSCAGSGFRIANSLVQITNGFARGNNIGFDVIESSGSRIFGHAVANRQYGLRVLGTQRALFDMICRDNSVETANTYSGVYVGDSGAVYSILNVFRLISNNTVATGQKYGYEEVSNSGNNKVDGSLQNNQTGPGVFAATTIKRNIIGYVTEAKGTAYVLSGVTSGVVTHGLAVTPVAQDVLITPVTWGSAGKYFLSTLNASQFTVNVNADPTLTAVFGWHAAVL